MPTTLEEKIQADNLRTWLEIDALRLGTDNQRERWGANQLPELELVQLARDEIFRGLDGFERWQGRDADAMERQLKHAQHCARNENPMVARTVYELGELTADEWSALQAIRDWSRAIVATHPWFTMGGCEVELRGAHHAVVCTCEATIKTAAIKVKVTWAGRPLVREYRLAKKPSWTAATFNPWDGCKP